jgi:aminodeoxyfutalosine deaminase
VNESPGTWEVVPKAELHVHLFGAIPVETLLALARRYRVALPADSADGLAEWFRYRDFDHFQEVLRALRPLVNSEEDVELITYGMALELARQGVKYAEVMVTPMGLELRGMRFPGWLEAMNRARDRAREELGLELRWILDINRAVPEGELEYWADHALDAAVAGRDAGVVGFGISGAEPARPAEAFAPWFERALSAGLHSAPHAGELCGPGSIWAAINALGAERIAHGVRAIEDQALVSYLAEERIALDLCPTSNVSLGIYPSLARHPLRRLHEAGVPVTVNSDDPTMFGVTLNQEVDALGREHQLDAAAIRQILNNGFRFAFDQTERTVCGSE